MKIVHLAAASALALSGLAVAAPAFAQETPSDVTTVTTTGTSDDHDTSTEDSGHGTPDAIVDGTATVTLAGLGDITFTIDPATGEIQTITVTPVAEMTAGDPIGIREGIELTFTATDGTIQVIKLRTETEHGVTRFEVESETEIHEDESEVETEDESEDEIEDDDTHHVVGSESGSEVHSSGSDDDHTSGTDDHGSVTDSDDDTHDTDSSIDDSEGSDSNSVSESGRHGGSGSGRDSGGGRD